MSWQPICRRCFDQLHPGRWPRVRDDDLQLCCLCAAITGEGIYVRLDPSTVPFPMIVAEDA